MVSASERNGSVIPLRGLGILGSGWQMHTCILSPLFALLCAGVPSLLSRSLSSCSTMPVVRFLVVRKGGLSSGVNGVLVES